MGPMGPMGFMQMSVNNVGRFSQLLQVASQVFCGRNVSVYDMI